MQLYFTKMFTFNVIMYIYFWWLVARGVGWVLYLLHMSLDKYNYRTTSSGPPKWDLCLQHCKSKADWVLTSSCAKTLLSANEVQILSYSCLTFIITTNPVLTMQLQCMPHAALYIIVSPARHTLNRGSDGESGAVMWRHILAVFTSS